MQISDAAMNEWKILVRMVFPERFEVKASPESVTKDGTYQYEYTQFVFEFYDTPDEKYGSNGTFFLSGSGYCGWLYQIDVNTYLYSDNYDGAGVMSFYEEDGKTYMCDYSDSDPTKGYELLATYEYID